MKKLSAKTVKNWYVIHKWTSLICTLFLLMLCITGLPLIFHHELLHLLGDEVEAVEMAPDTENANLDRVIGAGLALYPDETVRYVYFDPEEPEVVYLTMYPSLDADDEDYRVVTVDARTAEVVAEPLFNEGILYWILRLHVDMFAGLYGMLFLGFMGLLFVVSLISGVVVYGPFMRKLDFGIVRKDKTTRLKWLDLHNLLGVVVLSWALVVGATGVINTLSDVIFSVWRNSEVADMTAAYQGKSYPEKLSSLQKAIDAAKENALGMRPTFVAYPGSLYSSNHHYAIYMNGNTAGTSHIYKPVLIDAETSEFTDSREMPWYIKTLFMAQPLHFGDYGGMPMKILWAVLDVITIIVLGSGVYLWLSRRKKPIDERIAELEREEIKTLSVQPDGT